MTDKHQKARQALSGKLAALGEALPLSDSVDSLRAPIHIEGRTLSNRIVIQPMEGCDGTQDGAPDTLTIRRYHRFAESGAAMIWFEAVAVVPEGRANPRQLMITEANVDAYAQLVRDIRERSMRAHGIDPYIVVQLTQSGRYSKPEGKPAPMILYHSPVFEQNAPIADNRIVTDDYLMTLPEKYAKAAALAKRAGFDAIDLKACHRYLVCESLSAYTREGAYGGDFAGRTRLIREIAAAIRAEIGDMTLTSRINLYDGFEYPYGWGMAKEGLVPDMAEPIRLVTEMRDAYGMTLWDFTLGNPYVNPHVNRPFDAGPYAPPESPLTGLARVMACTAEVKRAVSGITVVSSAHSYLRECAGDLAAGAVEQGVSDLAGFGRMAFAYPDFPADLLLEGELDGRKCCIACGKCSELMRAGSTAGCPVRDSETYLPIYRRDVQGKA